VLEDESSFLASIEQEDEAAHGLLDDDDMDCICKLLFTFDTPSTIRARDSARDFSSTVRTTPFSVTIPRSVSTLMRVKFDTLSFVNFPWTDAVIVASSMVRPAVFPVMDSQPVTVIIPIPRMPTISKRYIIKILLWLKVILYWQVSAPAGRLTVL
jgi:hypothetical protein